ncbi:MAG: ATP-binding protein [Planctomycetota bacterium]
MLRAGLLVKTVLVVLFVFGAAAVAFDRAYLPWLEASVRDHMEQVNREIIRASEDILVKTRQLSEHKRRGFSDLPYELTEGDAAATRKMVEDYAAELGDRQARNMVHLADEFRARAAEETERRSRVLAGEFRETALTGLVILLTGVFLLLSAFLAVVVLGPLGRLSRATGRVAEGHLDERVGLKGRDEVGRLGAAFDRMTATLQASREEIEELNRTLEAKVEEKSRALVHAQTMASLGTLAGGVAHEFNNLLGGIQGIAADAREEEDLAEVRAALTMIQQTSIRACNITENLLRFSKPPAREARETDLAGLVADALDLVGPEARKRGIEVTSELGEVPPAEIDPGQIHQVVLNLLTNALHAMESGGRLSVAVRAAAGSVEVEISDTGPGIPPEERKRIFEPFFTTRDEGTGLGLSVSYSIVAAHDGEIEVGAAEGGGATFTVRLPVQERN